MSNFGAFDVKMLSKIFDFKAHKFVKIKILLKSWNARNYWVLATFWIKKESEIRSQIWLEWVDYGLSTPLIIFLAKNLRSLRLATGTPWCNINVANANAFKGVSTKNKKSRLIPTLVGWNEWTRNPWVSYIPLCFI